MSSPCWFIDSLTGKWVLLYRGAKMPRYRRWPSHRDALRAVRARRRHELEPNPFQEMVSAVFDNQRPLQLDQPLVAHEAPQQDRWSITDADDITFTPLSQGRIKILDWGKLG